MKASLPINEAARIKLLHDLGILDTPREQSFDDIAHLAMTICAAPIAVVTMIDKERQWFKSCVGLEGTETSRDLAFCAHAILQPDQLLIVEDTLQDPRFADHPAVTGDPYIRFYAGAPLELEPGLALGTLCVVDYAPRQLTHMQLDSLRLLARQVVQLILLHQRNEQLRNQAEQFQMLTNSAPILIGQMDCELRYVFCNHKYQKWFGRDPHSMIGKTPAQIFGSEYLPIYEQELLRCLGGERVNYEQLVGERYFDINYVPIFQNDQVKGLFTLATDITQQKVQQRALEKERENLAAVIRGANIGTWHWNAQTGEVIINERWAAIVGYSVAELEPVSFQTWLDLGHPEDLLESNRLLELHLNNQLDYYDCKVRMRHRDGSWVWIHSRGQVTGRTAEGKPEWMSGTHADITEAEESHQLIEQSEKKLAALYQLSPVAITLNRLADGEFLECNPEFYRMLGYTPESFKGCSYWDITPREYESAEQEQLASLHIAGRYGPYEKHYIHRDGHWISVLLNGVLIESSEGGKQIWSIIQDITERKRIEQMKNDFVSAVSHELRTPLTSITGSLGLVINGLLGEISPKAQQMLNMAHKNAQRLALLINDLLDMEKLVAGKMDFELQPQLLLPIIEQSLEANRVYAGHYGVTFSLRSTTGAVMVNVDAQRLQQVMANFLSNAAKFSPPDRSVDIHLDIHDERVRISVIDHGPGISDEFRARIFQKFSQADASSSRQRGGTGLGLAISKELVERMQGEIGFHSEPGQGATFFMSFPIAQALSLSSSNHNEGSKL
jgi:PAS domain S-box-containing protein